MWSCRAGLGLMLTSDFFLGDPTDPHCSSFGGTCRRTHCGHEFFPDVPLRHFKVYFDHIDRSLHDSSVPIEMPLGLVSADAPDRSLWCGCLKGGQANHFCTACDVHRADIGRYHDFYREPNGAVWCKLRDPAEHLDRLNRAGSMPKMQDSSTGVDAKTGCVLQHKYIPNSHSGMVAQDHQHNYAHGPLVGHFWLSFRNWIRSDKYPLFNLENLNNALCSWPWHDLCDPSGTPVSSPVLFTSSTFDAKPGNPNKPRPNKIKWTAGMAMAVAHDMQGILAPLLSTPPGSSDAGVSIQDDETWISLVKHCNFTCLVLRVR